MDKNVPKDSTKIAGRIYNVSDYQKNDEVSSGLATTHEQYSDSYTEGEIGAVLDDVNGKDIPASRKGFTE